MEETMNAHHLRNLFLEYFRTRDHAVLGSASLIPEGDPSVLFTTAGMHPLAPFLLGEPHPAGQRLASCQKCLRTNDILEVGDATHLTFFEMLGNWSLGDYWKPESIRYSYDFLTNHLGLAAERLSVTCFAGDPVAARDEEAAVIWRDLGIPAERIFFLPKADNWWGPAGATGPCGPDTEIFYDTQPDGPADETPATNGQRFVEIWNNVFMQYDQQADGQMARLQRNNVDTGLGLERVLTILQGVSSPYATDLFAPLVDAIQTRATTPQPFAVRVIADHVRAATFVLAEGIRPGNVDQPYVARRLIRRAIRYGWTIGITGHFLADLANQVIATFADVYPELESQGDQIATALDDEETRFQRTLARGERASAKLIAEQQEREEAVLAGEQVFHLYETYGFPAELTQELAAQQGLTVDMAGFQAAFATHQAESQQGAAGRFRGGLAERRPETVRLHTATHLLHAALRQRLGAHVAQRGSNITPERLRFDFNHPAKVTAEELQQVEALVNAQIARDLPVHWVEMSTEAAKQSGAIGLFEERYGEQVKVYTIGDFSKEICGGPHVEQTGELGHFQIIKEEAVGTGIRRIRAVLQG
ncbi:MAG: alanine--tRNA ligase [Caldilineaceae bacterium]|nr:alanine--tRNA ligase [Caldilineaceae bacterium]